MAANKVREKVTSLSHVMRCRADVMGAQEAPCLGAPFGEVPWRQQGGFVSTEKVRFVPPYPRADMMGLLSAVTVRWRTPEKMRCRTPELT